jgi:hypothetical protein
VVLGQVVHGGSRPLKAPTDDSVIGSPKLLRIEVSLHNRASARATGAEHLTRGRFHVWDRSATSDNTKDKLEKAASTVLPLGPKLRNLAGEEELSPTT